MRPAEAGYWQPHSGTMDFCEPNYEHSHYVAEFWNTISSVPILLTGIFGVCLCRWQRLGHEQMLCYTAVAVVGAGSIAFHATLMRTGQVADEVPMLWSVMILIYAVAHHADDRRRRQGQSTGGSSTLGALRAALFAYAVAATALYCSSGFVVFAVGYGLSVLALVILAVRAIFTCQPATGPKPRQLLACAALAYGGGWLAFWVPAEAFCHHFAILPRLPLHALFHLTSAAGPHLGLTAFAMARFEDEHPTAPPSIFFAGLPAIDRGRAVHKHV